MIGFGIAAIHQNPLTPLALPKLAWVGCLVDAAKELGDRGLEKGQMGGRDEEVERRNVRDRSYAHMIAGQRIVFGLDGTRQAKDLTDEIGLDAPAGGVWHGR